MDATWTAGPLAVVMTLAMGIGAAVFTFVGLKIWEKPKLPKDLAECRDQLEIGARMVIRKNIELMEAVRFLADTCKTLPPEYLPVAYQVMRLAKVMEEASFDEGVNNGLFPRPMFNASGPPTNDGIPVPGAAPQEQETQTQTQQAEGVVVPFAQPHSGEWINGQILRTG